MIICFSERSSSYGQLEAYIQRSSCVNIRFLGYCFFNSRQLYRGDSANNELLVEGTFGYDWGAIVDGDNVYLNEYTTSNYALVVSKLVKIDLKTLKKEVLSDNTVLRGRCKSGELVALSDYMLDANKPKTNRFCKLYNLGLNADYENNATVLYINPENGETVYSVKQKLLPKESFDERYIERTLEEVMG